MSSSFARRLFSSSGSVTYVRRSMGSHLHRIDGYSLLQQCCRPGEAVTSKPFAVGGRKFQLRLYPNGITADDHRGSLSADLKLVYSHYNDRDLLQWWHKATAMYRVSIVVDGAGDAASHLPHRRAVLVSHPGYDRRPGMYDRREEEDEEVISRKTCIDELVAAEEPPLVLGDDDCLRVRCDVAVVDSDSKWWRNSWVVRLRRAFHVLGLM